MLGGLETDAYITQGVCGRGLESTNRKPNINGITVRNFADLYIDRSLLSS
jgi:hypothetical protein